MSTRPRTIRVILLPVMLAGWLGSFSWARADGPAIDNIPPGDKAAATEKAPASETSAAGSLAQQEEQVVQRYRRFEEVLLRMAELTGASDPKRAALLRKAVAESKQRQISPQLEKLAALLSEDRLAAAFTGQQEVDGDLAKLLELLLSEQRSDKLKEERERLKQQLRKIKELLNRQVQLQEQNLSGEDAKQLTQQQEKLAEETGRLAKEIGDCNCDQSASGKKKTDEEAGSAEKNEPTKKPNSKSPPKKQGEKQPVEGEQTESEEQQEPKTAQAPPGQQRVAAARQRMEAAQKQLEKAQREGAQQDQEQAVRELERAKAELEEILRQMREEEMERVLVQLEARFRKMLELQTEVYDGTKRLDRVPLTERTRSDEIESGRLGRREALIQAEAEKALVVLREEGTATAMPEAVEQMRDDMESAAARLGQFKIDARAVALEEDILAALEEMIASLQKAQRENEQRQQQAQPGQPGEPPLIDKIAELKMIRALQMRVNTRTRRYSELVQGEVGQAAETDLLEQLRQLAEREQRVYRAAREIVLGKNQ
ncbi:MAG TPA: hypothetical protein VHZ24_00885 [Pirellulales bacterium]|nr:hypothetical protein [Pirellulales bacterium]